jgi:hypothetical protein
MTKTVSVSTVPHPTTGVVPLLLKDHKAMRALIKKVRSKRATPAAVKRSFHLLEMLVQSHMASEEVALLDHLKTHPKFEDHARESWEEHRIHEQILRGIHALSDLNRVLTQMKIFCEILEDHLDEEEQDLFPQYKEYFALSTRKKAGRKFLKKRLKTSRHSKRLGALAD